MVNGMKEVKIGFNDDLTLVWLQSSSLIYVFPNMS